MFLLTILLCLVAALSICVIVLLKSTLAVRVACLIGTERMEAEIGIFFWKKKLKSFKIDEEHFGALITGEWPPRRQESSRPDKAGKDIHLSFSDWCRLCRQFMKVVRSLHLSDRLCLSDFIWKTSCGFGEARATAMACGIIWSIKYSVMPLIGEMMTDRPLIEVAPLFQGKSFVSRLSCMVTIKMGEAMLMMRQIKRQMKEGESNDGSPDSGLNEDSTGEPSVHDRRRNDYRRSD